MAERRRRKRQHTLPKRDTEQSGSAQLLPREAVTASAEKPAFGEERDNAATPEEPRVAHVSGPTVAYNNEGGINMAKNGETMSESAITTTGTAIKDGLVGSLKGLNEIEAQLVSMVGNAVSDTLRTTGTVARDGLTIAKDVVSGTVQTVADVGTGLTNSAKNVVREVVTDMSEVGGDVLNVAQQAAKGVIAGVADIGAMVGDVANRTARGTVETTKEVGGSVGALAKSTLEGAITAADSIGGAAVKTVSHLLVSVVEGVKDVLNAALPRARAPKE